MLNPEPLIFIDSANKLNQNKNQTVYDSRYKQVEKVKEEVIIEELDEDIVNKLDAIIELYMKNKMVICEVITTDGKYEGIPISKDDNNLVLKQQGLVNLISLDKIVEVNILRI